MKSVFVILAVLFSGAAYASDASLPTGHTPKSKIWIDYSDLNYVLSKSVLDMGPSTHQRAGRPEKDWITNIYVGNSKATRHEGNRVAFHEYKDQHKRVLKAIRDDLLALPTQLDLTELSRNHQLAYWLNLHNTIVLMEMAEAYPVTNLKPFFDRSDKDALIVKKRFTVGTVDVTLADIQDHVLENWNDPLVIYGFYMGAVGTPNIRQDAFRGDAVYDQLRENAYDFVNSVRGTQIWKTGELRVATYYERMAAVFPNFEDDVIRHVKEYASKKFARRLVGVASINARIDDWNIADIYNGRIIDGMGSYPRTVQTIDGIFLGPRPIPMHVRNIIIGRSNNFKRADGSVEIDELDRGQSEAEEEPDEEKEDDKKDPKLYVI